MSENDIIDVSKLKYDENNTNSKQSANSLFNFMKKLDYLKLIIKNKAFIPRYCEEVIDYLDLKGVDKIAFPMTCFCDIHIQKIYYHCRNYGKIGIGMVKNWGINNGVQPIHYINNQSRITKELQELFKIDNENIDIIEPYKDYLLEHVLFIKPLKGKMLRKKKYETMNFHDEREWRYVPIINDKCDLPEVISQETYMNENAYNNYSKGIIEHKDLWLKFEYDDIRYIFVNDADRDEIIDFIAELNITNKEKYILISKITTLDTIEEDL